MSIFIKFSLLLIRIDFNGKLFHTMYTEYSMRICSKQETTYLKVYRDMSLIYHVIKFCEARKERKLLENH